jgi:hypothetical protein
MVRMLEQESDEPQGNQSSLDVVIERQFRRRSFTRRCGAYRLL